MNEVNTLKISGLWTVDNKNKPLIIVMKMLRFFL